MGEPRAPGKHRDGNTLLSPQMFRGLFVSALTVLLSSCVQAPNDADVRYEDAPLEAANSPAPSADAARTYLEAGDGPADAEPIFVGWLNEDPAWDASLKAALSLVNLELGGADGRPITVLACANGRAERRCAERMAGERPFFVLIGRTQTPHDELRAGLTTTPAVGIESDDPSAWTDTHTSFFTLNTPGVLRAASTWAGKQGYEKVLVLTPIPEALDGTLTGLGDADVSTLVLRPGRSRDADDRIERALTGLAGEHGRIAVLNALDQDGCISLARALAREPRWSDVDVITTGNCAGHKVHDALGDWPPRWYHVGSGPNLQAYELDSQAHVYRDRLGRYTGEDADWTAANSLPFATFLTALRAVTPLLKQSASPDHAAVHEALTGYTGPGYMGMPTHRCGYDKTRPALCVHLSRIYRYAGQRDWRNVSGEPSTILP